MKETLQTAFGRNLRQHRLDLGVSRQEFAAMLGFHSSYVGALERGDKNPSLRKVESYAEALGVDIRYLLRE